MAIWNVLIKNPSGESEARRAERAVFLREKFSFAAFLFAPLALLRFRLWLAFVSYLLVLAVIALAEWRVGLPEILKVAMVGGLHAVVGLELPALRAWKLRRVGFFEAGAVVANNRDDAERRFFAGYEPAAEWIAPETPHRRPSYTAPGPVIGSFPEPRAS